MASVESFGPDSSAAGSSGEGVVETPDRPAIDDAPPRGARVWAWLVAPGVVAALASWGLGEAAVDTFLPKTHVVQGSGGPMTIASPAERMATQSKNAALAYGLLGAVLGAAFGLAGGLARGSARAGVN